LGAGPVLWKAAEDPLRKQGLEDGIQLPVQVKGCFPGEKDHFDVIALAWRKMGPLLSLLLGEDCLVLLWFSKSHTEPKVFFSMCLKHLLPLLVGDMTKSQG